MLTLGQIETLVYGKMGVGSDSTTFDAATVVRPTIASTYQNVCGGQIADMFIQGKFYMAPMLRALAKQVFVTVPSSTTLSADLAAGVLSVPVADSSAFPASGALFVEGEVLPYSANSLNSLTLYAASTSPHTSGAEVTFAYPLPSDWGKPVDCMNATGGDYYDFQDDRGVPPASKYYTVKPGVGTSGDFLWISQPGRFRVTYVMNPTALNATSDLSVLPETVDREVIAQLVSGSLLWGNFADDALGVRGKGQLMAAYAALTTFYSQNAIKDKKFRRKVQVPAWSPIPSARR